MGTSPYLRNLFTQFELYSTCTKGNRGFTVFAVSFNKFYTLAVQLYMLDGIPKITKRTERNIEKTCLHNSIRSVVYLRLLSNPQSTDNRITAYLH